MISGVLASGKGMQCEFIAAKVHWRNFLNYKLESTSDGRNIVVNLASLTLFLQFYLCCCPCKIPKCCCCCNIIIFRLIGFFFFFPSCKISLGLGRNGGPEDYDFWSFDIRKGDAMWVHYSQLYFEQTFSPISPPL
jgi:hypothetical protein